MSATVLTRIARGLVAAGVTLAVFGAVVMLWLRSGVPQNVFMVIFTVFFAVIVWLVSPQQPRNVVVWTLAFAALTGGIYLAASSGAALTVDDPVALLSTQINELVPADLPRAAVTLLMVAGPAVVLAVYGPLTLGLLYFPDGRPPSPRWRVAGRIALLSMLVTSMSFGWGYRPSSTVSADSVGPVFDASFAVMSASVVVAVAALVVRYRRSDRETRQQIKWVVWGAAIFAPTVLAISNLEQTPYESFALVAFFAGAAIFVASYGIAIARHRLYDVDIVISRTATYSVLALLLAGVYAVVVVGVGSLMGRRDEPDLWLSLGAIAAIAVAFEPVRLRVEKRVNRLVYGQRATPHEVLSRLTSDLMESHESEDSMTELARLLAEGTGASRAIVWLRVGENLRPTAAIPGDGLDRLSEVTATGLPESDTTVSVPVRHSDEVLGAVTITKPRNEPVTEGDRRLLEDVAAGAGLMFRNQRLRAELADRARQVSSSRRRLIEAHDSARHRLERDLHDGAQQQVVALKVKLGLAHAVAEQEGFPDLADAVASLADETQRAVDEMRALAHGIYPPLLEAEGVGAAVSAATRSIPIQVDLDIEDFGRYARSTEETAYFIITELMGEAVNAGASRATLRMKGDGGIWISLTFDAALQRWRSTTISDRIEAAGGEIEREIAQHETQVEMHLPVRTLESAV